jgi:hypothetical protein
MNGEAGSLAGFRALVSPVASENDFLFVRMRFLRKQP